MSARLAAILTKIKRGFVSRQLSETFLPNPYLLTNTRLSPIPFDAIG